MQDSNVTAGEVIYGLQIFRDNFKNLRKRIEEMDDEALVALYEEAKMIGQVSWMVRCMVLGTAKGRAMRGDGAVRELAKTFGIGIRMAEIDIRVFDTFIKDDPDFEPMLPAHFYQLAASKAANPKEAIDYALERRYGGKYTASDFRRDVGGDTATPPAPQGLYRLVVVPQGEQVPVEERTKLSGNVRLFSVNGEFFGEIA